MRTEGDDGKVSGPSRALEAEAKRQVETLLQGAAECLSAEELEQKIRSSLATGTPLRVKLGADPSAPDIHIGHAVVLRKLRQFQEFGHRVTFVIGDYTGLIGDPSGRSKTRPQLGEAQIKENALTYQQQVNRILDPDLSEITFNSQWLAPLKFIDMIRLASTYTVARMLERDDFENRYRSGQPIGIHEFLYPLVQAYDSVALRADVELGGTDQKFNLLLARQVQREYGQEPQVTMVMPLLVGTDGQDKMSKSLGNYVGITDSASEMFGRLMSIPDQLIGQYLFLAAGLDQTQAMQVQEQIERGDSHPRQEKARMAALVVARYHGQQHAEQAASEFDRVFRDGQLPDEIPVVEVHQGLLDGGRIRIIDLMRAAGLCESNSEGRRLVSSGAVRLDDVRIDDPQELITVAHGQVLRVGRRRFARISTKSH